MSSAILADVMIPGDVALAVMEAMQHGAQRPLFTGSRAFGVEREDSDWDFLVYGSAQLSEILKAEGWAEGASMGTEEEPSQFDSLRKGDLNLIVALYEEHYQRFARATELCVFLRGPADRNQRIAIFDAVVRLKSPSETGLLI